MLNNKKILIVDDSTDLIEVVCEMLTKLNYTVFTATGFQTLLKAVTEHEPDMILMDVNMPGFQGDELVEMIQKGFKDRCYRIPILYHSSIAEDELAELAQNTNVQGYIRKSDTIAYYKERIEYYFKLFD